MTDVKITPPPLATLLDVAASEDRLVLLAILKELRFLRADLRQCVPAPIVVDGGTDWCPVHPFTTGTPPAGAVEIKG